MAKVRVPKELRPPKRFDAFKAPASSDSGCQGMFRVMGVFRIPKEGEYFWYQAWQDVGRQPSPDKTPVIYAKVILERVK